MGGILQESKKNTNSLCPTFTMLYVSVKSTYTANHKKGYELRVVKVSLNRARSLVKHILKELDIEADPMTEW